MTIENPEKYQESSPDWAMLKGCFGTQIQPEDIDGHVERGGLSLFLEHKLPGGKVKMAQDIAFDALRNQGNTVIVFWSQASDGADTTHMQIYRPGGADRPLKEPATLATLREACSLWFKQCPPLKRRYPYN